MATPTTTTHASAVLVGAKALLIRGPASAGKSRLAFDLIEAGRQGTLPFARLVGDDRVHVEAHHGRLLVRPAPVLAGLLEIRGLGIRRLPYEPIAAVGLVVDLAAEDALRLPEPEALECELAGITLPRLPVGREQAALPLVLAYLTTPSTGG
ncbi:HPr kinase/phosphatase C-terminal domain-containing protein [Microbacteriaceae bacterium K1510]|nr:HPr kinase/phosphatase C-terminal domain-containing protein [Microbacteriaceae bacterium K1510]